MAAVFYEQAEEEHGHAMKMAHYLLDCGAQPDIGSIDTPQQSFADHADPITHGLEQERTVTVRVTELFEIARDTRDCQSDRFLHEGTAGRGKRGEGTGFKEGQGYIR